MSEKEQGTVVCGCSLLFFYFFCGYCTALRPDSTSALRPLFTSYIRYRPAEALAKAADKVRIIVKSAFGGVAGYGILSAMRYGVGRGVFSNEAGLGSAPIAHSASNTKNPVEQGVWGVFEVFITTIIISLFVVREET